MRGSIEKTTCCGIAVLLVEFELGVYSVIKVLEGRFLFGKSGAEVGNVGFMGLEDRGSFHRGGELDEEGGIFRRPLKDCGANGIFSRHFCVVEDCGSEF